MKHPKHVNGWQTTDGKVHETEAAAKSAQESLDFIQWCDTFLHIEQESAQAIWRSWKVERR